MASRWAGRFRKALSGTRDAGSGLFADVPIHVMGDRESVYYYNDFLQEADYSEGAGNDWVETQIVGAGGAAALQNDRPNGLLQLQTTVDNEGVQTQFTGTGGSREFMDPATRDLLVYESRVQFDLTQPGMQDWFIGIAEATVPILNGAGVLTGNNVAGFHFLNGTGQVLAVTRDNAGTQQSTAIPNTYVNPVTGGKVGIPIEDTFSHYGIRIEGRPVGTGAKTNHTVEFYITPNTNIVDGALTPILVATQEMPVGATFGGLMSFTFAKIGGSGVAEDMEIDYVLCSQSRAIQE